MEYIYGKILLKIQAERRGSALNFFGQYYAAEYLKSLNAYFGKKNNGCISYN